MNSYEVFDVWYEFTEDEYAEFERKLRAFDGKRRLIRQKRKGIFEMILVRKWLVDRADDKLQLFEKLIRKELTKRFLHNKEMIAYVERLGIVASARYLQSWTQKSMNDVINEALKQMKEAKP